MAAYVIVQITIEDPVMYDRYKELAPSSIRAYGGKYIARGGRTETLEGSWSPGRLVLLEFPDMESARAWVDSPEYAEARSLRQHAASSEMLLVEGL